MKCALPGKANDAQEGSSCYPACSAIPDSECSSEDFQVNSETSTSASNTSNLATPCNTCDGMELSQEIGSSQIDMRLSMDHRASNVDSHQDLQLRDPALDEYKDAADVGNTDDVNCAHVSDDACGRALQTQTELDRAPQVVRKPQEIEPCSGSFHGRCESETFYPTQYNESHPGSFYGNLDRGSFQGSMRGRRDIEDHAPRDSRSCQGSFYGKLESRSDQGSSYSRRDHGSCPSSFYGGGESGSCRGSFHGPQSDKGSVHSNRDSVTAADQNGQTWDAVYMKKAAMQVAKCSERPKRPSHASHHSWLTRSSHDVPVAVVLESPLYSEQGVVQQAVGKEERRPANAASSSLQRISSMKAQHVEGSRGSRSAELVREIKEARRNGESRSISLPVESFRTPQGYVEDLTLEEEAQAIVSPATCMAITKDGIKYRSMARRGAVDIHAANRKHATDAQLARLAFNLPSVRDVEHRKCRNELRLCDN